MKEVDKKDAPDVSGGYTGPLCTDPTAYPITEYPKLPNGDPTGEGDLPVGSPPIY